MPAKHIFRLDDIAPNMRWDNYLRIKELFQRFAVKPVIGVIPDNKDPKLLQFPSRPADDFWDEIRKVHRQGWTIAQHGYQHCYLTQSAGLLGIKPASEFAGLEYDQQFDQLRRGKLILNNEGIPSKTFMAPSHSFDAETLRALVELGFTHITDGCALFPYKQDGLVFVPQLFATPRRMAAGVFTWCIHLNTTAEPQFRRIERFIERYHPWIIPFESADQFLSTSRCNRSSGRIIASGLKTARQLRCWGKQITPGRTPLSRRGRADGGGIGERLLVGDDVSAQRN